MLKKEKGRRETTRVFTLIEMVVVIAILAILMAILLPALATAQRRAQAVQCTANLHQLGAAMTLYAMDYRWRLPPYVANSLYEHAGVNWAWYLRKYYDDVRILDCPTSPQSAPEDTHEGLHLYDGNYGWNYDGTQGNRGSLYAHVSEPSEGYLFFDSGDQCIIYGANNWDNLMEELDLDWDSRAEGPNRHSNHVVISFVDGHVGQRELMDFLAAPCATNRKPWYIEWTKGELPFLTVPYPDRD